MSRRERHIERKAALATAETLFYCIGAQKSGTTWLYQQLAQHSEIHLASKELHYWDTICSPYIRWDQMGGLAARNKLRQGPMHWLSSIAERRRTSEQARLEKAMFAPGPFDRSGYLTALCNGWQDQPVIGDMTPSYALCSRATYAEMAALHPNSRFIFVMRDPVDRLWSGIRFRFRDVGPDQPDLTGLMRRAFDTALEDVHHPDHRRSDYQWTIGQLEAAVPADRILYVFYDDLFAASTLRRITDFLGVAALEQASADKVNEGVNADMAPTPQQLTHAADVLKSTYDLGRDRFGADVPPGWMQPAASAPRRAEMRSI